MRGKEMAVERNNEMRAGIASGLAAFILIMALTAMAFLAFQPPGASMEASSGEASAAETGAR